VDTKELVGEVAKRHGLILDEDDPLLVTITLCEFILNEYVEKLNVNLDRAFAKEMRARESAEALAARAGAQVAQQIRSAGDGIVAELARVLDGRTEVIGKEVAEARRLRQQTLWGLAVSAVVAAVMILAVTTWSWRGVGVARDARPAETGRNHAGELHSPPARRRGIP
jgi:hypothetical protein